ncbi:MAG: DUF6597 domain-containing transcriptional factor [Bacteroidota bacterium]
MIYKVSKPSFQLSKFIKQYWTLDDCIPTGGKHIQRIVPSGLLELVFYFDDKPIAANKNKSNNSNTLITGQLNEYYDIEMTGKISLFSIIFQPHGLSSFLDIPLQELYNQNVPLNLIFKNKVNEIETKLFEARSFKERIIIVEDYFFNLLKNKGIKYNFDRINNSICKINQMKGLVEINDLALEACYSRKQFERIFSHLIGTSPKQFLKIIRFQHAIHRKSIDNSINLTDLTYQCGYYDQAHMINDFQKLSGMTPKQYFNDCEPYSDYFQ